MFFENYTRKCKELNKTPTGVAVSLGIGKSAVTWWKKGKLPTSANLEKLADFFSCSTDELLGREETEKPAPISGDEPNAEKEELIALFDAAPPEYRAAALAVLRAAEAADKAKGSD